MGLVGPRDASAGAVLKIPALPPAPLKLLLTQRKTLSAAVLLGTLGVFVKRDWQI